MWRAYVRLRPKMSAINTVTPTPVINSMSNRISRLAMCAISCAITPRNSAGDNFLIMPRVKATDASFGVRPVANAFNDSSSMIYTRGVGIPAAKAVFSTKRNISRFCGSWLFISWAFATFKIIESPNDHEIIIQIAHIPSVGIATVVVVCMASLSGATNQVNKNTNPINIHGNNVTSNAVFMLF